jgi:hypothetical protein
MKKLGVSILAVVLVPILFVVGCLMVEELQVQAFYESHALLNQMANAPLKPSRTNDPTPQMTDILLERVPIGTNRSEAIRVLSSEKLRCGPPNPKAVKMTVCSPIEAPASVGRWWVELTFNTDDEVSSGRAMRLK